MNSNQETANKLRDLRTMKFADIFKTKNVLHELHDQLEQSDIDKKELEYYEQALKKNSEECQRQWFLNFVSFIIFTVIWFLVKESIIKDVSLFEIHLSNTNTVLIYLPVICAFIFYRLISLLTTQTIIDEMLFKIYKVLLPKFGTDRSSFFLITPSFLNLEAFVIAKGLKGNFLKIYNAFWNIFMGICLLLIPCIVLIAMIIYELTHPTWYKILIAVVIFLIITRIIIFLSLLRSEI